MQTELQEFLTAYPSVDLDDVPLQVWEKVKTGTTLCAAYSEYEASRKETEKAADEANAKNSAVPGAVSGSGKRATLTAKEVAAMTPAQVKANYAEILASMEAKGFYDS